MGTRELNRVREIALAMPRVTERQSHGAPCFFVQAKRPLCYYHDHHRGDARISVWCPAYPDVQEELVRNSPDRFFKPLTSASGTFSGWLGIFLDSEDGEEIDWDQVAALLRDAYRRVGSKTLIAELDGGQGELRL